MAAWRSSKARDTYGPIVELVKKQQEIAKKTGPASYTGTNLAIANKPGKRKLTIYLLLQFTYKYYILDQEMETSQTLALMPAVPTSNYQPSQAASNVSAVGGKVKCCCFPVLVMVVPLLTSPPLLTTNTRAGKICYGKLLKCLIFVVYLHILAMQVFIQTIQSFQFHFPHLCHIHHI